MIVLRHVGGAFAAAPPGNPAVPRAGVEGAAAHQPRVVEPAGGAHGCANRS